MAMNDGPCPECRMRDSHKLDCSRRGEGQARLLVRLPDLIEQVHDRSAQTVDYDTEAGLARLLDWIDRKDEKT